MHAKIEMIYLMFPLLKGDWNSTDWLFEVMISRFLFSTILGSVMVHNSITNEDEYEVLLCTIIK